MTMQFSSEDHVHTPSVIDYQASVKSELSAEPMLSQKARLLGVLIELLRAQRAAIIKRDAAELDRLFDKLSDVAVAFGEVADSGPTEPDAVAQIVQMTAVAKSEIGINRKLFSNGMAVGEHFVRSIAAAAQSPENLLFTGVA